MKRYISLLLCALMVFALFGCAENAGVGVSDGFYGFIDDSGRSVNLKNQPEKVAVLFSSYAEMWILAGGEVKITVGESIERGFAPKGTPLVDAGAGKTIDREALLAAEPDFVIASADIAAQAELAAYLDTVGIPCALFRVDCFADYEKAMTHLCAITGRADLFEQNVASVGAEIENLLAKVDKTASPRILFVRCGSSYGATKAKVAAENFVCKMLEELGAVNIADAAPELSDGLALEAILDADPEVIFFSTMGNEQKSRAYMDSVLAGDAWQTLSAVREGRYVYLDKNLFQFKPNAKWSEAYKFLAEYLYGEN
ncbi:MAG: ABC transporter substrate-binding protein [Clostridia bacterium]|nr:ABC transporter substrate-binding protein [Clostridia bacterium]